MPPLTRTNPRANPRPRAPSPTAVGLPARAAAAAAAAALVCSAWGQSITTLFNRNNGGANGGAVFFDIVVGPADLEFHRLDTNTNDVGVQFGWTVHTRDGTSAGFESTTEGWSVAATGTGQARGMNIPSPVTLSAPFILRAGRTCGIALVIGPTAGHDYSGSGTSPSPGLLQYSNADLTLNLGAAMNVPFSGGVLRPRIWNGTLHYRFPFCRADCDHGTGRGVLDVFDFLCFQDRFAAGHPYACDCDASAGPGVCDVFDFLCFQNAFEAGCP